MSNREKIRDNIYEDFDKNSPRPPVPGEERVYQCTSDWGHTFNQMDLARPKSSSPTPRKRNETSVPSGFEPEGSYRTNSRPSSRHDNKPAAGSDSYTPSDNPSPPPCLRWARSLHQLLEDPDGVELFRKYLESEGRPHADCLNFWFACEGLRNQKNAQTVQHLCKLIYRRFFPALPINDELRREVGRSLKSSLSLGPPVTIFDEAQAQIENLISTTTYPGFLKSDMYLQYVQSIQNPTSSSGEFSSESSSSSSTRELSNVASGVGPLPTLHEDIEFVPSYCSVPLSYTPGTGSLSAGYLTPNISGPVRLTKDMLWVTQHTRSRDVRPKPEAFAGLYMYRGVGAHVAYNSYNPVSRQDSEMQSVSSHSDTRTESDYMSLTDSSIDGRSLGHSSRRRAAIEAKHARESAALNRETQLHHMLIPRTVREGSKRCEPMDPQKFAAILIEKLENVKRDQDTHEMLDRKLKEGQSTSSLGRMNEIQPRDFANAIREKLQLEDDNDQDILDQHVSRVFSDLTSAKSPGITSPRVHSPTRNRMGISTRSSSKKTAELTDSGVSVMSDTPPVTHSGSKDHKVLTWLLESDRSSRSIGHTHSEISSKHKSHRSSSTTSPNAIRHRKCLLPAQPFVADPSMPPLSIPDTAIQLEEAKRRLEDEVRPKPKQRSSSKHFPNVTQSSQSTLRKSTRDPRPLLPATTSVTPEDITTVVFSFCDDQFPYRTKISGTNVTLRQFKECLPKKGNYRYFFKKVCEELDNSIILEEVSNDMDVLPLLEGKIMAQVQPVD